MRSSASLLPILLVGCGGAEAPVKAQPPATPPPEVARADGPRATAGAGVEPFDRVGMATWYGDLEGEAKTASGAAFDPDAIAAAHRTLPLGSIAEVTALATGRTILVRITDRGPHDPRYEIDLTRGAANLLGTSGGATPVRVRAVTASAADAAALARGEAASPRMDAPPALLAALRRQLPAAATPSTAAEPPRKATAAAASPAARAATPTATPASHGSANATPPASSANGRYVVQVAAFSTRDRAAALATSLGGAVLPTGALWRVRIGPYRDLAAAQRARDAAHRRGYADARIIPAS